MRYPIVQQHDATDCGPAVLAMAAAHHGRRVSIAKLRELAGTDRQGTNLAGLATAAEQVGFQAKPVRATGKRSSRSLCRPSHTGGKTTATILSSSTRYPRNN